MVMKLLFQIDSAINGRGPVVFSWQQKGNFLATAGVNRRVHIFDRQGKLYHQIALESLGDVIKLEWDREGDALAILQASSSVIPIFYLSSKKVEYLETKVKELSYVKWSPTSPVLAICSAKGTLLLYNRKTTKLIPIKGKHTKQITCGDWSTTENVLGLGSSDLQVTISNADGDTIEQCGVQDEPLQIEFNYMKRSKAGADSQDPKHTTISANLGGQNLWLFDFVKKDEVILSFSAKYGAIHSYKWFGDGYILVAFKTGTVCVISTHMNEIGSEIGQVKAHTDHLNAVAYSDRIRKGASIGDNCVKIFDMTDLKTFGRDNNVEKYMLESEYGQLSRMEWTDDGQILTVGSDSGKIFAFLTSIPVMNDCAGSRVLYLSSLRELCVKDILTEAILTKIEIDIEPSFVTLGVNHVGVGMNNRVWYYRMNKSSDQSQDTQQSLSIGDKDYGATVDIVKMNSNYAAVLVAGKVVLHCLEKESVPAARQEISFPEPSAANEGVTITTHHINEQFLIFGTSRGNINYFSLEDWAMVSEFRYDVGIQTIFPNINATRVVFIDETHAAHVYNPVDDAIVHVEKFPGTADKVLWDLNDPSTFIVSDRRQFTTYVYACMTKSGLPSVEVVKQISPKQVNSIASIIGSNVDKQLIAQQMKEQQLLLANQEQLPCKTERPDGFQPMLYMSGKVVCQTPSGSIGTVVLASHDVILQMEAKRNATVSVRQSTAGIQNVQQSVRSFYQYLNLLKFTEAWNTSVPLSSEKIWMDLVDKALAFVDIEISIRVYQKLGNAAMVIALERLLAIDETNVVLGHIALLQKDFSEAERRFLQSSQKIRALELRRDLMHWDRALLLAEKMDPLQIPPVAREYASQLELKGEYDRANEMYEKSLATFQQQQLPYLQAPVLDLLIASKGADVPADIQQNKHVAQCIEGIARCTIRLGNFRRGVQIAASSGNKKLCRECAAVFEEVRQFNEAAALYVKAEMYERAADIYIQIKNYKFFAAIMSKIKNPKVFMQYAKAKEQEGKYEEALQAYEQAGDNLSVVRLHLDKLNNPSKAIEIVKQTNSASGAALIAQYCLDKKNFKRAIEFFVMAGQREKAFEIAKQTDEMDTYALLLKHADNPTGNEVTEGNKTTSSSEAQEEEELDEDEEREQERKKQDFLKMAEFYESKKGDFEKAADYYTLYGDYERALQLYLQCVSAGAGTDASKSIIDKAIEVVGKAKRDELTHRLVDFLMGDLDGVAKDMKHIFKLYMELGNYKQAARTSSMMAKQEQDAGNYIVAHDILFNTHQQLMAKGEHVPQEIKRSLMLLHSYIVIKDLVPLNEPALPARMLVRVARNISKFPLHIVQILTSTVIQSYKANMKKTALEYASVLARPEYIQKIDPKYKKTISAIVRKRDGDQLTDDDEPLAPCPFCGLELRVSELDCLRCQNHIPFCLATGQHMTKDDCCQCPNCKFPALYSRFIAVLGSNGSSKCPMCTAVVEPQKVRKMAIPEAERLLRDFAATASS